MSAFTGPLTITELDVDCRCWSIEQLLRYEVGSLGSGQFIDVPPGYVTDGATIPRMLWWWLPPWGRYSRPAALHDLLCTLVHKGTPHPLAPTRRDADRIFREAMAVCGVDPATRWIMWLGVRLGAQLPGEARNSRFD